MISALTLTHLSNGDYEVQLVSNATSSVCQIPEFPGKLLEVLIADAGTGSGVLQKDLLRKMKVGLGRGVTPHLLRTRLAKGEKGLLPDLYRNKLIESGGRGDRRTYRLDQTVKWAYSCRCRGCQYSEKNESEIWGIQDLIALGSNVLPGLKGAGEIESNGLFVRAMLQLATRNAITGDHQAANVILNSRRMKQCVSSRTHTNEADRATNELASAWVAFGLDNIDDAHLMTASNLSHPSFERYDGLLQAGYLLLAAYIRRELALSTYLEDRVRRIECVVDAYPYAEKALALSLLNDSPFFAMESIWLCINLRIHGQFVLPPDLLAPELRPTFESKSRLASLMEFESQLWSRYQELIPKTPRHASLRALYFSKVENDYQKALDEVATVLLKSHEYPGSQDVAINRCYLEAFRASAELDLREGKFSRDMRKGLPRIGNLGCRQMHRRVSSTVDRMIRRGEPEKIPNIQLEQLKSMYEQFVARSER